MNTVWVVGQNVSERPEGIVWEFQGVFTTEEKAIDACCHEDFFIGPVTVDEELPEDTVTWPGCYYPLLEPSK